MKSQIKNYIKEQYTNNNKVKVHICKIDYEPNKKYNIIIGVYVNDYLTETFEVFTSNNDIDLFMSEINTMINKNNLYVI